MTKSIKDSVEEINQVKKNLNHSMDLAKEIPMKINKLLGDKKSLEEKYQALLKTNNQVKEQLTDVEHKISEQRLDFEKKLETSQNKIFSIQRELNLSNEEIKNLKNQIKTKEDRINILESQKKELTESLRAKEI